ncbi:MAG: peptide ABC transporter substrate-binding protein [Nitrososphaerota archaeon]
MLRQRKLWYLLGVGLLLMVTALAACGPTANPGTSNGPKKGGSIIDGLYEEPDSLLPQGSIETYADLVDATIWAPLFYGDNTGIINAGLAKEVPTTSNGGISSDGLTYTIHLRPNLKFSDGSPLTSDDVVFTIGLIQNKNFGAKTNPSVFANIDSVSNPDPSTVIIKLKEINVAFLALALTDPINFTPLPKAVYGSMDPATIFKSENNLKPAVTSGPFMISDRVKADHITVKRNPNYYQAGKPYLDQITFKIIPDQNTILTALQNGQIDTSWFLDINKLDQYKAIQGYKVALDKAPASYEAIYFNMKNAFLSDIKVRQAITMGIDISPVIQNIWKGIAVPTCDDGTGTFAHDPSLIPCYKHDPAGAKQLLESDGFTMGSNGYYTKGGKTLELRYSTTAGKAYREQTEQVVQDQLKQIGIKINIVNYPADTYFGSVLYDYGKYDIAEYANSLGYDPDNHTQWACDQFTDKGGFNVSAWCNQTADAAIKTEMTSVDQNARKAAFKTLYQQIIQDLPAMYYYAFPDISVAKATLQNYAPSPSGPSETWNVWDWYLK